MTPHRQGWLLMCILIVLLNTVEVGAQSDDAIQEFRIVDVGGALFAESYFRTDDDKRSGRQTTEKDLLIRYGLDLNFGGYVYHPNLIDWSASLMVGQSKQDITVNDEDRDSDGDLLGYNLSGHILRTKPVSFRVQATRSDQFINRSFTRNIELTEQVERFEVFLKGDFSVVVMLEHTDRQEETLLRTEDEDIFLTRTTITDERDRDRLTQFIFEYEDNNRTTQSFSPEGDPGLKQDLPETTTEFRLVNEWSFGPEQHPHLWRGQAHFRRRTGAFVNDILSANQSLELNHTDTFSTFYHGEFRADKTSDQEDRDFLAEIGFRKDIYASLNIIGRINGEDRQFEDGSERRFGGELELDYRKETPVGIYTSTLIASRRHEEEDSDAGILTVRDEAVTLVGTGGVRLSRPNISPGSIVVTDLSNAFTYVEGFDYRLGRLGSFTEITRLITGRIADGETVLVDYRARAGSDTKFRTEELIWRHRIELEHLPLALYLEYRNYEETLESDEDPGNLDRDKGLLLGAELTLGDLILAGEHERRDQRLSEPFVANRFRADFSKVIDNSISFTLSGDYEKIEYDRGEFDFEEEEDFLESYGAAASLVANINREWLVRVDGSFAESRGRDNGQQARIGAKATWRRGQLDVSIEGYRAIFEQDDDEGTTDFIGFTIRREF